MPKGSSSGGAGGGGRPAEGRPAPTGPTTPTGPVEKPPELDPSEMPTDKLFGDDPDVKPGGVLTGPGVKDSELSPADRDAISAYTGLKVDNGERFAGLNAENLNKSLYDKQGFIDELKLGGYTPSEISDLVKRAEAYKVELNASLNKLKNYEGEVYRTIKDPGRGFVDKYVVGKPTRMDEFVSTSRATNPSYMPYHRAMNGKIRFKIQSKSGKMVENVSRFYEEREVLFRSGTKFMVRSKNYNADRGTWDIDLVEL
jgi:hypothetical protein